MTEKPRQDRLLDHNYDGIQEYDNPMPRWWLYIFYATIVFSILYALNVPGIGIGKGRIANYEREVAEAKARLGAQAQQAPPVSEETLRALLGDPAKLAEGKATFDVNCSPCHRADGGGNIGPNLTDDYWLHGGRPLDIYTTVNGGVLDKGMPAWGQTLKPDQVTAVAAYVMSLHDTHPANPKPPQGVKAEDGAGTPVSGEPRGVEREHPAGRR
jgi:cytochrome c oxidase cbb3-type subunit 3